jgi:hypothetical protein
MTQDGIEASGFYAGLALALAPFAIIIYTALTH